jgi:hypothetical protein
MRMGPSRLSSSYSRGRGKIDVDIGKLAVTEQLVRQAVEPPRVRRSCRLILVAGGTCRSIYRRLTLAAPLFGTPYADKGCWPTYSPRRLRSRTFFTGVSIFLNSDSFFQSTRLFCLTTSFLRLRHPFCIVVLRIRQHFFCNLSWPKIPFYGERRPPWTSLDSFLDRQVHKGLFHRKQCCS